MNSILTYLKNDQKLSSFVQILHLASYWMIDWQNRFSKNFDSLHVLAYWAFDEILSLFFEKDIDINIQDNYEATALQLAVKHNHKRVVLLLLKNEININMRNKSEKTALYWAARNEHKIVVKLLLMNKVNVMTKNNEEWSALDWAVIEGKNNVMKMLLKYDVDVENDERNKTLYLVTEKEHEITMQMLLDNEVNVNAIN